MKELKYIIKDPQGIHARPAGELVKLIQPFASAVTIAKGEKKADAKRIFGIMSLAAAKGDEVTFAIEGADEDETFAAVEKFMQEKL